MNRIFILGDNHGRFRHILREVKEHRPDVVISVGDLTDKGSPPLEDELKEILGLTQFWWIPGNHESDSEAQYDATFGSALADRNLHGRMAVVAGGLKVAGLGGVFRGQVWLPPEPPQFTTAAEMIRRTPRQDRWRGGLPRRHRTSIFPVTIEAMKLLRADVLLTHEAPSCHPHGFSAIDELAQAMGVRKVFHGHHHDNRDYGLATEHLGFETHGVGLCGITDLDGKVVVSGMKDSRP